MAKEFDYEFWHKAVVELEDFSMSDCKLQWLWNRYCAETGIPDQEVLANDVNWFKSAFEGYSLADVYYALTEEDYSTADQFARKDEYGRPLSSDDREQLITHEEYNKLLNWTREEALKWRA